MERFRLNNLESTLDERNMKAEWHSPAPEDGLLNKNAATFYSSYILW